MFDMYKEIECADNNFYKLKINSSPPLSNLYFFTFFFFKKRKQKKTCVHTERKEEYNVKLRLFDLQ